MRLCLTFNVKLCWLCADFIDWLKAVLVLVNLCDLNMSYICSSMQDPPWPVIPSSTRVFWSLHWTLVDSLIMTNSVRPVGACQKTTYIMLSKIPESHWHSVFLISDYPNWLVDLHKYQHILSAWFVISQCPSIKRRLHRDKSFICLTTETLWPPRSQRIM